MTSKKIKNLYAVLATAAAQKAVDYIVHDGDYFSADLWAANTESFLVRAGADASRWYYNAPKIRIKP